LPINCAFIDSLYKTENLKNFHVYKNVKHTTIVVDKKDINMLCTLCGGMSVTQPNNKNHMNMHIICTIKRSEQNNKHQCYTFCARKTENLFNMQILGEANKRSLVAGDTGMYKGVLISP